VTAHDDLAPDVGPDVDRLAALRAELEQLDTVPVADRVARFEHVNDVLARELAALDEV
jgi:hypothetical protein